MYEMSKMTLEQEEVRNQEYNEYVEQMTPKHNLWANMGKAFLLGGGICLLGQIILQIADGQGFPRKMRAATRFLLEVATCFPASSSAFTNVYAGSTPPMVSTTMPISGSFTIV